MLGSRFQPGLASPILSSCFLHLKAEHPFCLKEIVQGFQRSRRRLPCVGHGPPSLAWPWSVAAGKTKLPVCFPGLLSLIPSALAGEAHLCAGLPPHATPTPHHRKPTCPPFLALGTPGSVWTPENINDTQLRGTQLTAVRRGWQLFIWLQQILAKPAVQGPQRGLYRAHIGALLEATYYAVGSE